MVPRQQNSNGLDPFFMMETGYSHLTATIRNQETENTS
jgi:hypothetical protein